MSEEQFFPEGQNLKMRMLIASDAPKLKTRSVAFLREEDAMITRGTVEHILDSNLKACTEIILETSGGGLLGIQMQNLKNHILTEFKDRITENDINISTYDGEISSCEDIVITQTKDKSLIRDNSSGEVQEGMFLKAYKAMKDWEVNNAHLTFPFIGVDIEKGSKASDSAHDSLMNQMKDENQYLREELRRKDEELRRKDDDLRRKDEVLREELRRKDEDLREELRRKDEELRRKDEELREELRRKDDFIMQMIKSMSEKKC